MTAALDFVTILAVLANLTMLSVSGMRSLVRAAGAQGLFVGLVPALVQTNPSTHILAFVLLVCVIKGLVLPRMLLRTLQDLDAQREVEPYVGFGISAFFGVAGLAASVWFCSGLPVPGGDTVRFALSGAFMTILTGFLLIITRKKALTQVVGYLIIENGVFLLSAVLTPAGPLLVELCILLDLFVAVFVMGIALHHINQAFDSIDTDLISTIKD